MGNEMYAQVGNISSTASIPAYQTTNTSLNSAMPNSLFNTCAAKNYSNDFIMPDFIKTGNLTEEQRAGIFGPMYIQGSQIQQQQTQYQPQEKYSQYQQNDTPAFNEQQQAKQAKLTPEQMSEYYKKLLAENPDLKITEKGNLYESAKIGKTTGVLTGIGTALVSGIKKLCAGTELKNAFNLKSIAVKLPVLAVAGWAVGSLIDAFINNNRAQQADAQTQTV